MSTLVHDLRVSARSLLKSPAFTSVAVLSLALGIGINTVMFTIVNAVLLRQLPYRDSDQLVSLVSVVGQAQGMRGDKIGLSGAEYGRVRDTSKSVSGLAGYQGGFFPAFQSFRDPKNPRRIRVAIVTHNLFSTLGSRPMLGRDFAPDDGPTGQGPAPPPVVIISYSLWQSQFGGDPKILNGKIALAGAPSTLIGIMPPEFQLPTDLVSDQQIEAFYPYNLNRPLNWIGGRAITVVGRIQPGKQLADLQAELNLLSERMHQERPDAYPISKIPLTGFFLKDDLVGDVRNTLLLLAGAVGIVLLIACLNVASLLLARATARRREMALRATLGAGRARLVRQLLTEALLLATTAGAVGLLIAHWMLGVILAVTPVGALPRAAEVGLDWRVLLFTLAISIASAVLFGLAPAVQASRINLNGALREEGRSGTAGGARQRLRSTLVIAEVALALVLVIGAGLFLRSFSRLLQVDPGFNPHQLLTARISLPIPAYPTSARVAAFFDDFRRRMKELPGVTDSSAVDFLPLSGPSGDSLFEIEGKASIQQQQSFNESTVPRVNFRNVVPGYFEAMEMRLRQGRFLNDVDRADGGLVVVVNETLAKRFLAGETAVGKRLRIYFGPQFSSQWMEIVGVTADSKLTSLDEAPKAEMFVPAAQFARLVGAPPAPPGGTEPAIRIVSLLVRSNSPSGVPLEKFREAIRGLDPLLAVFEIQPVDAIVSRTLARPRFILTLLGAFAAVAFLLAVIGIYGLISYSVTQRTREIGIRMALGAEHRNILKLIVGQGSILAVTGVVAGLAVSLFLTRIISSMLFGVSATDPATFIVATVILVAVAALASYIPARRAAKIDPMIALRME